MNCLYHIGNKSIQYAKSFAEILDVVLKYARKFIIDGFEKIYGVQGLHMIRKIVTIQIAARHVLSGCVRKCKASQSDTHLATGNSNMGLRLF